MAIRRVGSKPAGTVTRSKPKAAADAAEARPAPLADNSPAAKPAADVARRQSAIGELHRLTTTAVRVLMSAAGIGIVLLVLTQIALDTFYPTIDIKPVSVPADVERLGYRPDVVSLKLADEIDRLQKAAPTGHRRRTLYFDRPPLDLTMPGLGFWCCRSPATSNPSCRCRKSSCAISPSRMASMS
ncbi:MAG: hypothetical protein JO305_11340 [Alphaproteobacteria bacterium]|nr:hypothetical protein [Alphaproteobacteria bacterium]